MEWSSRCCGPSYGGARAACADACRRGAVTAVEWLSHASAVCRPMRRRSGRGAHEVSVLAAILWGYFRRAPGEALHRGRNGRPWTCHCGRLVTCCRWESLAPAGCRLCRSASPALPGVGSTQMNSLLRPSHWDGPLKRPGLLGLRVRAGEALVASLVAVEAKRQRALVASVRRSVGILASRTPARVPVGRVPRRRRPAVVPSPAGRPRARTAAVVATATGRPRARVAAAVRRSRTLAVAVPLVPTLVGAL